MENLQEVDSVENAILKKEDSILWGETMEKEIIKELDKIEKEKGIEILYAVETGSRAWRMESANSDWDVRFVFVRRQNDYLRINKQAEVIEITKGDIDIVGFDIYKFTKQILNSNPNSIEWLESDIVYANVRKFKQTYREFIQERYNPLALQQHYRSMCKQNYLKYLKSGNIMTHKKYLYAMRGLCNAMYVYQKNFIPPIVFEHTLSLIEIPDIIKNKLFEVIKHKKSGKETDKIERLHVFDNFIESFLKCDDKVPSRRIVDYQDIQDYMWKVII